MTLCVGRGTVGILCALALTGLAQAGPRPEGAATPSPDVRPVEGMPAGDAGAASRPVFCPACGAENRAGSRFCKKDGTPLPALDAARFDRAFIRAPETFSTEQIQDAVRGAARSVVRVRVKSSATLRYPVSGEEKTTGWLDVEDGEAHLVGSGFASGQPGEIITNAHVASPFGTPAQITVETQAGQPLPATVVGVDPASDLALLRVAGLTLPPLPWTDAKDLHLGEETWAVGYPLDIGLSLTRGTISSIGRTRTGFEQVESFVHSDAYITHGNSGGPLVDVLGHVVGVGTMGYHEAKGQGYSIPAQMVRYVTDRLRKNGKYERGFVGLQARPIDSDSIHAYALKRTSGVVVESVFAGSPAAAAGFKPGDVLLGINGRQAPSSYLIQEAVSSVGPGALIKLNVDRAGQTLELAVTTSPRPAEPRLDPVLDWQRYLMIRFEEDPKMKGVVIRISDSFSVARRFRLNDGVRVRAVLPAQDWPAQKSKLPPEKLNPTKVGRIDDLRAALAHAYVGGRIGALLYLDRDADKTIAVVLDETWPIIL